MQHSRIASLIFPQQPNRHHKCFPLLRNFSMKFSHNTIREISNGNTRKISWKRERFNRELSRAKNMVIEESGRILSLWRKQATDTKHSDTFTVAVNEYQLRFPIVRAIAIGVRAELSRA